MTLKNLTRTAGLLMIGTSLFITGCDKDDDDNSGGSGTITDVVVGGSNYSLLEQAVVRAELATTLSGTGPFTVFAPDDAAFTASSISSSTIASLDRATLASLLLYHTIPGKIMAADVPAGPNAKVVTAGGDSVFVTRNSAGVFINGIQVAEANISATNGVIHRIPRVLKAPVGNVVVTAQQSGLDSLLKAVTRATTGTGGNPGLTDLLNSSTATIFAPTNQAFTGLLTILGVTDINQIPVATLVQVLSYHVVTGRKFSSDLSNASITMLSGGSTTINLTNGTGGGPTVRGTANTAASNITATNILTTKGVVHLIDRVLLP